MASRFSWTKNSLFRGFGFVIKYGFHYCTLWNARYCRLALNSSNRLATFLESFLKVFLGTWSTDCRIHCVESSNQQVDESGDNGTF